MITDDFLRALRRAHVLVSWAPAHRAYVVGQGAMMERVTADEIRRMSDEELTALIERNSPRRSST